MPASPWKSYASANSDREYLVLGSYLQLQRFSATFRFVRRAIQVRQQLARAPKGLMGYSLLGRPWARQYWTLSVWEDEAALQAFVAEHPHVDVMSAIAPEMETTRFVRWPVEGSSLPPAWPEVLRRIEDADRSS
jgi:heme-degrading monooxygenase HmoA